MGVEKRFAGAPAGNGEGESHDFGSAEGAQNLTSGLRGHNKQGNWNYVYIRGLPDGSFHADAGFKFFDPVAVADHYAIASFLGGCAEDQRSSYAFAIS